MFMKYRASINVEFLEIIAAFSKKRVIVERERLELQKGLFARGFRITKLVPLLRNIQ